MKETSSSYKSNLKKSKYIIETKTNKSNITKNKRTRNKKTKNRQNKQNKKEIKKEKETKKILNRITLKFFMQH